MDVVQLVRRDDRFFRQLRDYPVFPPWPDESHWLVLQEELQLDCQEVQAPKEQGEKSGLRDREGKETDPRNRTVIF